MDKFQCLFGIKREEVRDLCVLVPVLMKGMLKGFGVPQLERGKLYSCGQAAQLSLIKTGIGAGSVGDAVLYLKETGCKKVILFGTCGLLETGKGLSLGSLVTPQECLRAESFSEMLERENRCAGTCSPAHELMNHFLNHGVRPVHCLTVASLKLEEERLEQLKKTNADVVDMECSALFTAAGFTGIKAAALFYVADVIGQSPFYRSISFSEKMMLESQQEKAIEILCTLP